MIDRQDLLADLKKQVKLLETDLRDQVTAVPKVFERLDTEYKRAFKIGRTAATWAAWRDERVTQAAVAWVLGTVFVRFCEDNGLLEQVYLAGPTVERMTHAEEAQEDFFRLKPAETDRSWILEGFEAIGSTQAGKLLFDERHNAAYQIPLSADAAKALIGFWRRRGEDGILIHDFTDVAWDTRFLGDLYQDLSESARKTYALLQTPAFVEEFILDLTLTPAIDEFGYDVVKMIDPTCGSGHFLLGAFHRLVKEWEQAGKEPHERVRLALDAVHGVDINPFAVAIARFRLLLAALKEAGVSSFHIGRKFHFPINIAIGDSLIKDRQLNLFDNTDELAEFRYVTEDLDEFPKILSSRYHVVAGNPPYITVKDRSLSDVYRKTYRHAVGAYTLSIPFAQRFFELATQESADFRRGYVGQITANSFMRQNFGKSLIEDYFAKQVNITHVIDSSGAYIPGHGTPTVIIFGRPSQKEMAPSVTVVHSRRGEPGVPEEAAEGRVWTSIVNSVRYGLSSEWTEISTSPRSRLTSHPWSLGGADSDELRRMLEASSECRIGSQVEIGTSAVPREHEAFGVGRRTLKRAGVPPEYRRALIGGESLREWVILNEQEALWPYTLPSLDHAHDATIVKFLWPYKTPLATRMVFGKTQEERGLPWTAYSMFFNRRFNGASISFPVVATHPSFVLDLEQRVFKQSAPVIKLPEAASKDDHLRLLGVLNSSTACFWLKQVSHDKGSQGVNEGFKSQDWERFYEFTGTKLQDFPLPSEFPTELATELDELAQHLTALDPSTSASASVPTRERLAAARTEWHSTRARMITFQEELDWHVYSLYGLLDDLRAPGDSVPELRFGERAFEIVLARRMAAGDVETQWFARHGSTPTTELPEHWAPEYKAVVERRVAVIESNRSIGLIERPECKRRWSIEGWDALQEKALRNWLLDRCEIRDLWFQTVDGMEQPRPVTVSQLADELRRDADVLAVAELYAPGKDFAKVIAELVTDEHVPYLAALRYKDSGLDKRADWEAVWDLQRAEDAAKDEPAKRKIRETIPVPPKYGSGDFLKASYWRNRGKLDVPKEQFISYPLASPDGDPSLLLGWAGWDSREQAQALATLIVDREQSEAWSADRLTPLLAGLREVLPWVKQWHNDFDPLYGGSPADIYEAHLSEVAGRLHVTDAAMSNWRPPKAARGRRPADTT
ncbi:BREX-2 system adenine-specific DNA-methyltransferase PglX [Dactylosporangium sp. NPDC005572]|uniref:BREX-2 system adenine-specific DNA-methyltransferase PglX n=1 Tax=Dactylosporangium sp. NPDC005572 TaxID=3156889 RepID=UPI0033A7F54E